MKLSKVMSMLSVAVLGVTLSACGNSSKPSKPKTELSGIKKNYSASGFYNNIKGTTEKNAKVTYSINNQNPKAVKVKGNGTFWINVVDQSHTQKIRVLSQKKGKQTASKSAKISAAKPIADYLEFQPKYNRMLKDIDSSLQNEIPSNYKTGLHTLANSGGTEVRGNIDNEGKLLSVSISNLNKKGISEASGDAISAASALKINPNNVTRSMKQAKASDNLTGKSTEKEITTKVEDLHPIYVFSFNSLSEK